MAAFGPTKLNSPIRTLARGARAGAAGGSAAAKYTTGCGSGDCVAAWAIDAAAGGTAGTPVTASADLGGSVLLVGIGSVTEPTDVAGVDSIALWRADPAGDAAPRVDGVGEVADVVSGKPGFVTPPVAVTDSGAGASIGGDVTTGWSACGAVSVAGAVPESALPPAVGVPDSDSPDDFDGVSALPASMPDAAVMSLLEASSDGIGPAPVAESDSASDSDECACDDSVSDPDTDDDSEPESDEES